MKNCTAGILALLILIGTTASAQSLTEISDFAADICDEIAQSGEITKQKIEGNINGKLSGVAKLLGGSLDAGGKIVVDEENYVGVPYEKLSDQLSNARECRRELAKTLLDERRRIDEERRSSGSNRVEACIISKIKEYEVPKTTSINGGATASSPGWKGGTNHGEQAVCHRVGSEQEIISAVTENTCCHGGRCSVTAPSITESNQNVCVTTKAWSESKSWGGGGCAKYNLVVTYKDVVSDELKEGFEVECL